jgi:amino-acid N-acetyltransferase
MKRPGSFYSAFAFVIVLLFQWQECISFRVQRVPRHQGNPARASHIANSRGHYRRPYVSEWRLSNSLFGDSSGGRDGLVPGEQPLDLISQELSSADISHIEILPQSPREDPASEYRGKDGDLAPVASSSSNLTGDELESNQFGSVFRQCAPYIAMHRGSTIVIHITSTLFKDKKLFDAIVDDISILHLLGVYIIIVAGVRNQLDEKIIGSGSALKYYNGIRITDESTLHFLKESSGFARFEIESSLARGFRGLAGQSGINVVSGNFFYSAKPFGVRYGVDFMYTGEVRRIESDNIRKRLESGDIVLLTSLGYSHSGEVYNVPSESLAAETAARLKAAKIVYLTQGETMIDKRSGKMIQSLRLQQAVALLASFNISSNISSLTTDAATPIYPPLEMTAATSISPPTASSSSPSSGATSSTSTNTGSAHTKLFPDFIRLIARSVYALNGGVKRAHLLSPTHGALLKELYTRDGAGTLISRDVYEGIRQAHASDVRAVEEIIRPLEDEGILVPRSREQLVKDMADCYLLIRDGTVLACGMLKTYSSTHAEICCLAVHPKYRREGRGETLLAYLERRSLLMGITTVFVLSTRTMQWFEERGFVLSDPVLLPATRQYNASRGSKVYIKPLGTQRDVDVEELLWNM